jgi:hypothetical protein
VLGGQRLVLEHVEGRGTYATVAGRRQERILVHKRSATEVHHPGARAHQRQAASVENLNGRTLRP